MASTILETLQAWFDGKNFSKCSLVWGTMHLYKPIFKDWLSKIKDVNAMNFVATTIAAKLYINIFYFGQPVLKIVL